MYQLKLIESLMMIRLRAKRNRICKQPKLNRWINIPMGQAKRESDREVDTREQIECSLLIRNHVDAVYFQNNEKKKRRSS